MPRERVHQGRTWTENTDQDPRSPIGEMRQVFPGEKLPDGTPVSQDPSLDVGWNRDTGWMQIITQVSVQRLRDILAAVENDELPMEGDLVAICVDFERVDANKLIRTVRRARDAAFGVDE